MMKHFLSLVFAISISFSCTTSQINQTLGTVGSMAGKTQLTETEVIAGLKAALEKGAEEGTLDASKLDGYFKNPVIKIPFPPDAQNVEEKLRQIGLGNEVDRFILTLNRAAEEAADEAKPIFVDAIRAMTIQDAWNILRGENDAATEYLRRTTSNKLKSRFQPIIQNALSKTNATKYYTDLINTYNKIPFVEHMNPNLDEYATQQAIDGLFYLVAIEEAKIRENPAARTSEILRKVFAAQD